jgi:hypothetical protein
MLTGGRRTTVDAADGAHPDFWQSAGIAFASLVPRAKPIM